MGSPQAVLDDLLGTTKAVLASWRYDARGFHIEPRTRGEDELETRLWCFANGLDPERWRDWCACDYEALPEEAA